MLATYAMQQNLGIILLDKHVRDRNDFIMAAKTDEIYAGIV